MDAIEIPVIYRCKCEYQSYFTITFYVYKGLLLIFGLFVAWETRNIKISAINDSRFIGIAVYCVAVLSVIAVIVTSAVQGTVFVQSGYLMFAISSILGTTVTLCLVFVPKIRILSAGYEDPNFRNGRPIVSIHNESTTRSFANKRGSDQSQSFQSIEYNSMIDQNKKTERSMTTDSIATNSTNVSNSSYVNSTFEL